MGTLHLLAAAIAAIGLAQPVHEIEVTAKKFTFEPAAIQVVAGEPVRLVLKSADSVHGFAIRELQIDVQIPKGGQTATVEFTAPPVGRYEIACSEFCGSGHGQMRAALVSVAAPTRTPDRAATMTFGAAAVADAATTIHYLEFHHGYEQNPLINWAPTPLATVAVGAALDLAAVAVWGRMTRGHPRVANAGLYVASGFHIFFAARNESRIARNSAACTVPPCQYNCVAAFSRCH
jgi:cytochrome c oxidase subunit 2